MRAVDRLGGAVAALPLIGGPVPVTADDGGSVLLPAAAALLLLVLASGSFLLLATRAGRLGDP